jgi:hypothetical protein|tara:strand:+ start:1140 stop:1712 length:573 start_codon:yes stop_codon:yes gene_type:complete
MKDWIKIVAKSHKHWVSLAKKLGGGDYSEDIVQEMYIKLHTYADADKTIIRGKLNQRYIYLTLYSSFINFIREKNKIKKIQIEKFFKDEGFIEIPEKDIKKFIDSNDIEKEQAYAKICNKMDEELKNWHWYDKKIFEVYRDTNLSIRGMAKDTKISFVNIFHTLKKGKNIMRDKFSEDYEDFKNEDYNKI